MPSGPAGDFPKHRLPYLAGSLPGAVLPPPSLGHSPSRRIVEDDDEDWCWQDAQTKHNKSGKCQYRQNQSTALLCGKGIWTKMCWPVDLLSRLKNPSLTAFFIVNGVVKAYSFLWLIHFIYGHVICQLMLKKLLFLWNCSILELNHFAALQGFYQQTFCSVFTIKRQFFLLSEYLN